MIGELCLDRAAVRDTMARRGYDGGRQRAEVERDVARNQIGRALEQIEADIEERHRGGEVHRGTVEGEVYMLAKLLRFAIEYKVI